VGHGEQWSEMMRRAIPSTAALQGLTASQLRSDGISAHVITLATQAGIEWSAGHSTSRLHQHVVSNYGPPWACVTHTLSNYAMMSTSTRCCKVVR
jgi:hypothetical protein